MKSILIPIFTLVLCFEANGQKYAADDCSLKALTNDCKDLGKNNKSVPNPWEEEKKDSQQGSLPQASGSDYDSADYSGYGGPESVAISEKMQELMVDTQAELLETLPGSPRFKLALTGGMNLSILSSMLGLPSEVSKSRFMGGTGQLMLPWPPHDPKAKVKSVNAESFKKEYLEKLSSDQRTSLSKSLENYQKKYSELYAKMSENMPYPAPAGYGEASPATAGDAKKNESREKLKAEGNARFEKLVEKAKALLIEELRARPLETTPEQTENMIKKIQNVKYTPVSAENSVCAQGSLNAFYTPTENRLNICPAYYGKDDLTIITVLGHELGHAIDPCGCRHSGHRINREKVSAGQLEKDLLAMKLDETEASRINLQFKYNKDAEIFGMNENVEGSVIQMLERKQYVSPIFKGIEGKYPFESTYQCLSQRHGFANREVSKNSLSQKKLNRIPETEPIKRKKSQRSKDFDDCKGGTEMGEVMSDVFGAKVALRYAAELGRTSKSDLRDINWLFAQQICGGQTGYGFLEGEHPYSPERVEKIFLADPLTQSVFGCKVPLSSHGYCLSKFGSLKVNSKKTSEEGKGAKSVKATK